MKFGGTSVANSKKIRNIVKIVSKEIPKALLGANASVDFMSKVRVFVVTLLCPIIF